MIKLWSGFKEKKKSQNSLHFSFQLSFAQHFVELFHIWKRHTHNDFYYFFLSLSWYISHQEDIKSNGKKWMWSSEKKTNNLKENERPILIFIFIIFHSDSFFFIICLVSSKRKFTHTHKQTNSLQMDDSLFYRCEINIILSYTLDFFFFIFYYYYYYLSCRTFSSFMFRDSCNLQKKNWRGKRKINKNNLTSEEF